MDPMNRAYAMPRCSLTAAWRHHSAARLPLLDAFARACLNRGWSENLGWWLGPWWDSWLWLSDKTLDVFQVMGNHRNRSFLFICWVKEVTKHLRWTCFVPTALANCWGLNFSCEILRNGAWREIGFKELVELCDMRPHLHCVMLLPGVILSVELVWGI